MNTTTHTSDTRAGYTDTCSVELPDTVHLTARQLFDAVFVNRPKWVNALLQLRDHLVRPLGLEGGVNFAKLIRQTCDEQIVIRKHDSHLTFEVSVWCSDSHRAGITTSVVYNNRLGRVYFALIKPFHRFIVSRSLRRATQHIH